jgi:hypothetical protein
MGDEELENILYNTSDNFLKEIIIEYIKKDIKYKTYILKGDKFYEQKNINTYSCTQ